MSSLLIVDDDRSIIRIFQRCFEHSEVAVHSAASGAEAVKMPRRCNPTLWSSTLFCPTRAAYPLTKKSAG